MKISQLILHLAGWVITDTLPYRDKCVICVAPHTSNWDFIIGQLAYASIGRKSAFLMKKGWFFFPLGLLLRAMGGIPVDRRRRSSLSRQLIRMFTNRTSLNLAITPEGTRKAEKKWHTGFLHIAYEANVPIQCGVIDYRHKRILLEREFAPTGDFETDLRAIKDYYKQFKDAGKHPDRFLT